MTQLTTLADTGLNLDVAELDRLFKPFLDRYVEAADPEWQAALKRRDRKIWRKFRKRGIPGLIGRRRTETRIVREYDEVWSQEDFDNYTLQRPPARYSPWVWHGRRCLASKFGAIRCRHLLMMRVIERLQPRRVLEVGAGNGINLIMLSGRFPAIEFVGIELTEQGCESAREFQRRHQALPDFMEQYSPLPVVDPRAFRRIVFKQGNAVDLPFADRSFDLVLTVLALEQMERIRPQALREIGRVAGGHVLMIEPFQDGNRTLRSRLNVRFRDYFRGRIGDLPQYGLEPVWATDDLPQEFYLTACAVLARRRA